jgi:hypothetical protein
MPTKLNDKMERAVEIGANELMNVAEHVLRGNKRARAWVRRAYRAFCWLAYSAIERAK